MLVHIFIFVFPFVIMQHIEDLTQEKFSLQRALEASRVLAESLATENSSLTENYNNQVGLRAIVCHFVEYSTETFQFLIVIIFLCLLLIFMVNHLQLALVIFFVIIVEYMYF
jgi:hypothetical protein